MKKFIIFFLLLILFSNFIYAAPQLPMVVSGDVFINGKPAKIGTEITAEINGNIVKSEKVSENGHYTILVQDAQPNEVVKLYVKGIEAAETTFANAKVETLNLEVKDMNKTYYIIGGILFILLAIIIFFFIRMRKRKT